VRRSPPFRPPRPAASLVTLGALLVAASLLSLAPTRARASTTVVDSDKELAWLERQRVIKGSVVVKVPGLKALDLPKLVEVTERLEIAVPDLVEVKLPSLREVGKGLNVGCALHPRNEWETRGPLSPLGPLEQSGPSFADGPNGGVETRSRRAADPGTLELPRLVEVGGGLAVCSPGIEGVEAPKLVEVGTDLQLYAGRTWREVELPALKEVESSLFVWLADATLRVEAPRLRVVGAGLQAGGAGRLTLEVEGLERAAGLVITGSRPPDGGPPTLALAELDLPRLTQTSKRFEVRSVAGLERIDAKDLERSDAVVLEDLPDLKRLELPALREAEMVSVGGLPAIEDLELALRSVSGGVRLSDLELAKVEVPLEQVGALVVDGVRARVLEFPELVRAGSVAMRDLGGPDLVSLPALDQVLGSLVVLGSATSPNEEPVDGTPAVVGPVRVLEMPRLTVVGETREHGLTVKGAPFSVLKLAALEDVRGPIEIRGAALTRLELGRLETVGGTLTFGGTSRVEVLTLGRLEDADGIVLDGVAGLKRLSARRYEGTVSQRAGTRVGAIEVGALQ